MLTDLKIILLILLVCSFVGFGISCYVMLKRNENNDELIIGPKESRFQSKNLIPLGLFVLTIFFTIIFIDPSIIANVFSNTSLSPNDIELLSKNRQLEEKVDHQNSVIEKLSQAANEDKAKKLCKYIAEAKYFSFHEKRKYIFTSDEFTEKYGIRATATDGSWDVAADKSCELSGAEQELMGIDTSQHLIEIMQDGKFKAIGYATAKYDSVVRVLSDGKLGNRKITKPYGIKFEPINEAQYTDELRAKICSEYDRYRLAVHHNKRFPGLKIDASQPCIPTIGERNHQVVIAFVCTDYIRVVEESKPSPGQEKQDLVAFEASNYCPENADLYKN